MRSPYPSFTLVLSQQAHPTSCSLSQSQSKTSRMLDLEDPLMVGCRDVCSFLFLNSPAIFREPLICAMMTTSWYLIISYLSSHTDVLHSFRSRVKMSTLC